ncbi:MAG: FHA domain-containing serine/threonine-protein kinase [Cyanobacteria bacterium P01_A01_bin.45]
MIGKLIAGHYKVLKILGSGGFGQTYLVEDILLPNNLQCVLKHIKPHSTEKKVLETARALFKKEADTLDKLGSHDQIPKLLDYFEDNQEFYLIQEFIQGHPLSLELPRGLRWTESEIIEMLIEVLSILEFIHTKGVIHRDVKPENIIRRKSDNKLIVIDFGAIKEIQSQTAINRAKGQQRVTITIGTPGYMPSEQIRRLPRASSDIYALGMIAIQALTGLYPRELEDDRDTGEILWEHLTSITPDFAAVLAKMTRYHFKERYRSASEALEALKTLAPLNNSVAITEGGSSLGDATRETNQPLVEARTEYEMVLEWVEAQQVITHAIWESQDSKKPGKIRIGRNPQQCDIVLCEPTVSGLHIEIFFHSGKQQFYVRNLRQKNPPVVDGQLLLAGEIPINQGSYVRLGRQTLKVCAINRKQYLKNLRTATDSTDEKFPAQEPVTKTLPPQIVIPSKKNSSFRFFKNTSLLQQLLRKTNLVTGTGVVGTVGAVAFLTLGQIGNFESGTNEQNFISRQRQMCRVVAPTQGKFSTKLRPQPHTEVDGFKQLSQGERVLFMQTRGDFVEVKLSDGTKGWVFWDQLQPCSSAS